MTQTYIQAHLATLTNEDLLAKLEEARTDHILAAATERDSEWCQACFAAVWTYATEVQARGIVTRTLN